MARSQCSGFNSGELLIFRIFKRLPYRSSFQLHHIIKLEKMKLVYVKVNGPYSLSKDALREEGCPWLIKSIRQGSLSNMGHFNTPLHMWHLWPNMCSTTGGKGPSLSKEPDSDTMLNYHLSQKLKLIGRGKSNHLINTLTLPFTCGLRLSFNR
jgi:hypothetical protein